MSKAGIREALLKVSESIAAPPSHEKKASVSMLSHVLTAAILGLSLTVGTSLLAQDTRKERAAELNSNTVFIAGGTAGATYHTLANDIAAVTTGNGLRVVSVATSNGIQNVRDLLYLRSIDLAFTNSRNLKVLLESGEFGPDFKQRIRYVAPLSTEELHVLAQPGIKSLEDLKGKRVNFHVKGSSSDLAGRQIFRTLGVNVQAVNFRQPDAIEKLRRKEIDATICICVKRVPAYASLGPGTGFKFIEIPYPPALEAEFLPSKITAKEYPNLVPQGSPVNTVALSTVLITLNWPKGSMRYKRNARFVEAFFSKFPEFRKPPRQYAWKTMNIAGKVRGWRRFAPAQEWLERNTHTRTDFDEFLNARSLGAASAVDREQLFREFLKWRRGK